MPHIVVVGAKLTRIDPTDIAHRKKTGEHWGYWEVLSIEGPWLKMKFYPMVGTLANEEPYEGWINSRVTDELYEFK